MALSRVLASHRGGQGSIPAETCQSRDHLHPSKSLHKFLNLVPRLSWGVIFTVLEPDPRPVESGNILDLLPNYVWLLLNSHVCVSNPY
jgi:hypothetical protein